ncbi:MAG: DUF2309 family protein, partial [Planctomycetaceae bacterium]|nr:DUF2309 family protein [Planctomycetaceae bacterium]
MISSTLEPHHPDLDSSCVETEQLKVWVEHAAHYLPSQGPIEVFVHHNTLHAFEDLPFCDAVLQAMSLYGHHPYLTENRYREEFHRDRIQKKDLAAIINADLKDQAGQGIGNLGSRVDLRLAMLESRLHVGPPEEVHWLLSEGDALRKFREEVPASARLRLVEDTRRIVLRDYQNGSSNSDPQLREAVGFLIDEFGRRTMTRWTESQWEGFTLQLLWQVCRWGVEKSGSKTFVSSAVHKPTRIRDLLLKLTGEDPDKLVHSILIPFTAAFLDQGYAQWSLPDRSQGFYQAFINLFKSARPIESWQRGLAAELKRLETEEIDVWTCIDESLSLLGLPEQQKEHLLQRTLLALPGWAGMIWQMETNA